MQGEHVVHAVARHGYGMTLVLQRHDELLFLCGAHAPEDAARARHLAQLLVSRHGAHVDALVGIGHTHGCGNVRDGFDGIAADDVDAHALLLEIVKRLGGRRTHAVANEDEGQRFDRADDFIFLVEIGDLDEHEHAAYAREAFDGLEDLG